MSVGNTIGDDIFRCLLTVDLDHVDRIGASGEYEIKIAVSPLGVRRIDDELAIDSAEPTGTNGTEERYLADGQGGTSAYHAQHIRIVVLIGAKNGDKDLHLIEIPIREERPDAPVDLSGCQNFFCARSAFSFHKTARKLPSGT